MTHKRAQTVCALLFLRRMGMPFMLLYKDLGDGVTIFLGSLWAIVAIVILLSCAVMTIVDRIKNPKLTDAQNKLSKATEELNNYKKAIEERQNEISELQTKLSLKEKQRYDLSMKVEHYKKMLESNLTAIPYYAGMIAEKETMWLEKEKACLPDTHYNRTIKSRKIDEIRAEAEKQIKSLKKAQYQLEYLKQLSPNIEYILSTDYKNLADTNIENLNHISKNGTNVAIKQKKRIEELSYTLKNESSRNSYLMEKLRNLMNDITYLKNENQNLKKECAINAEEIELFYKELFDNIKNSDLSGFPYLAGMVADVETYKYELAAQSLNWSRSQVNKEKQIKLREIRSEAKAQIEQAKIAVYQLEYLKSLYPGLSDILDTNYKDLPQTDHIPEHDPTRDYMSKEEWERLSLTERNQLALDRYITSHNKTNWQIGRDYELYVGYQYELQGFDVEYVGSLLRLEDMGRDLIVHKGSTTRIIQCKYWAQDKTIHEKHIFQLYGSVVSYNLENQSLIEATGIFVTNTKLSQTAVAVANKLGIMVIEGYQSGDYPRIKCNINTDEYGAKTKIYHLPMDQQYDSVKLDKPGECKVFTVQEAESLGFRRAYRWHINNE